MPAHPAARRRTTRASLALLALLAPVVAACGSDDDDGVASAATPGTEATDAPADTSETTTGDAPLEAITLKIPSVGNSGVLAYAEEHGTFEDALADLDVTIEWVPVQGAFSTWLPAIQSGDLNLAPAPITGAITTAGADLPLRVVALSDPYPYASSGIVVPASSDIETVEDLVGRSVVVNPGAKGEYTTLLALDEAGIDVGEVQRIPIQPPDAAPAFTSGEIDAWATFGPFFDGAVAAGARVIVREDELPSDDLRAAVIARTDVLEERPDVVEAFVDLYNELSLEAQEHPADFVNVKDQSGPTALEGDRYDAEVANQRNISAPLHLVGDDDEAVIERVSDLFLAAGVLDEPVTADQLFHRFE